jgi:hypothetical protein
MRDTTEETGQAGETGYYDKWKHHDVGVRIRICGDYIVHIGKDGKIDWENTTEHEATFLVLDPAVQKDLNAVLTEIVVAESNSLRAYGEDHQMHYLTLLGEAYVHWLEHDASAARRLIIYAKKYYRERSEEMSRNWYLTASMVIGGVCIFFGIISWFARVAFIEHAGTNAFHLALSASAGGAGALLSVIARSGKLKFRASSGQDLHTLEATSRIFAGAISGVIAYLALSSEVILGAFSANTHRTELMLLASIAAGTGERLATSIIAKFDDTSSDRAEPKPKTPSSEDAPIAD